MSQSQQQPAQDGNEALIRFEKYSGLNTQASRLAIADTEMSICDGWCPIGDGNLRIIWDVGTPIFTAPAGLTIPFYDFGNIGPTPYCIVMTSDGAIWAVNTETLIDSQIASPGTIQNPGNGNVGTTQWGSLYIIIVSRQPNGYFIWDGTNFVGAGQVLPGAGGPGPIASYTLGVGGAGYAVGDTGVVVGGINDATYQVLTESGGIVQSVTITFIGTLYSSGTAATQRGGAQPGSGTGLTIDLTVTGSTMPSGVSGSAAEIYSGHVWVINGDELLFSAPGSVTDFATSSGGGSATSNDSFLRVNYTQIKQSNGYLYLFGDSSISYIAGVQTSGNPPTTTYTQQSVDPEVGTAWPGTVDVLGSNIVFANAWGAHVSFGGRAAKVSGPLDGIYNTQPNFGGFVPSAAKHIMFGKRVWALLLPVIDSYSRQPVNKLFIWDEKRWFSTQQSINLTFCQHQEINSILTAYGTEGKKIYPLFSNPSDLVLKVVQSKFWSAPGGIAHAYGVNRFWAVFQYNSVESTGVNVSIDSEKGSSPKAIAPLAGFAQWFNDVDAPVTWQNNVPENVEWLTTDSSLVVIGPFAVSQNGVLSGITLTTNAADIVLTTAAMMPIRVQYRG